MFKKAIAFLLTFAMIFSLATTGFADPVKDPIEQTSESQIVKNPEVWSEFEDGWVKTKKTIAPTVNENEFVIT